LKACALAEPNKIYNNRQVKISTKKATAAGLLIALGIIYGDIGTSPLYVFNAIIKDRVISPELIIGSLSCIIWTLTLQTTIKYVMLVLQADNRGEGGTFALYALVRRRKKWLVIPAMIGGAALLADGMITPPISITSAVEGLKELPAFHNIEHYVVYIVIAILASFFFLQQFGTASIGKLFGPVMLSWFTMLAVLGIIHLSDDWSIFRAFSPIMQLILSAPIQALSGFLVPCFCVQRVQRPCTAIWAIAGG
jgi:KUP system potassium uptake protein